MVVSQKYRAYDALTIQISKTIFCYLDGVPVYRYVYEEIDENDMVVYARYMDERNIREHYKWAV